MSKDQNISSTTLVSEPVKSPSPPSGYLENDVWPSTLLSEMDDFFQDLESHPEKKKSFFAKVDEAMSSPEALI